jgi:hypothetical protein
VECHGFAANVHMLGFSSLGYFGLNHFHVQPISSKHTKLKMDEVPRLKGFLFQEVSCNFEVILGKRDMEGWLTVE